MQNRLHLAVLAIIVVPACGLDDGGAGPAEIPFECSGPCDSVGPMTVSTSWAPAGGFARVLLDEAYDLEVWPNVGITIESISGDRRVVDFAEPGFFELRARERGRVVAATWIRVADRGPEVELVDPEAGSFVQARPGEPLWVSGRAVDPLGEPLTLTSRGRAVNVDQAGQFRTSFDTVFGINMLDLRAVDRAGNEFRFAPSFLVAESYGAGPTDNVLRLGDDALSLLADELSSRLSEWIVVRGAGLVYDSWSTDFYFDGATLPGQGDNPGSLELTLGHAGEDRIHVVFAAHGDTVGDVRVDTPLTPMGEGTVTATDVTVTFDVRFVVQADGVGCAVENIEVSDGGISIEVDWYPDWLINQAHESIRDGVRAAVQDKVPEAISSALTGVAASVPVSGSGDLTDTALSFSLSEVVPDRAGMSAWVDASIAAWDGSEPRSPGPPRTSAPVEPAPRSPSIGVALSYDLLNQWAYVQWDDGRLRWQWDESNLASELARVPEVDRLEPAIDITVAAGLPPVFGRGERDELQLSAGHIMVAIRLSTEYFQVSVDATMAIRADIGIEVQDSVLILSPYLAGLAVDLGQAGFSGLDSEALEALIRELAPRVASHCASEMEGIPVPEMDLTDAGIGDVALRLSRATSEAGDGGLLLRGQIERVSP